VKRVAYLLLDPGLFILTVCIIVFMVYLVATP